jgi:hypothetical protein
MSNRHTTRRPNRRQRDPSRVNTAPVGLQWTAPALNGGNTVFEGALSLSFCRVANQAATPEVARITCMGFWDGVWEDRAALEVGNEGESPTGTLFQITFDAVLDLTMPWSLNIPSDSQVIQGPAGGRLVGTFVDGQPVTAADGGYVRQTSIGNAPTGQPSLVYPTSYMPISPGVVQLQFGGAVGASWEIVGTPPFAANGGNNAIGVAEVSWDVIEIAFTSPLSPGDQITFPPWDGSLRTDAGAWVAPFSWQT